MTRASQKWLLAVAALTLGSAVLAGFKEDYIEGLEELERSNWNEALTLLQRAARDEPKSQARMRLYGMRFSPYLPHYYLGLAHFRLGDCDNARDSFAVAVRNGVVAGLPENAQLQQYDAECAQRAPAVDPRRQQQIAQVQNQVQDIKRQLNQAAQSSTDPLWSSQWQANGKFAQQLEQLRGETTQLEVRLQDSNVDLGQLGSEVAVLASRAAQFASQVRNEFNSLRLAAQEREAEQRQALARQQSAKRNAEEQEQQRLAQAEKAQLNQTISETVEKAGEIVNGWPEEISDDRRRAELAQVIKRVYGAGNASLTDLRALDRDLKNSIAAGEARLSEWQEELASRPPEALVAAVDQYFQGNFQQTIGLLRTQSFDSQPAQFYQRVFVAAAHFQTAMNGDETTRTRSMQLMEESLRAAKRVKQPRPLDPSAFSPKFIARAEAILN